MSTVNPARVEVGDVFNVYGYQDNVLIGITDGRMDHTSLRMLPPWRAVLLARVAHKAGVMTTKDRDLVLKEARDKGGQGVLTPWDRVERNAANLKRKKEKTDGPS